MKLFIYVLLAGVLAGCASSDSHSLTQQADPATERNRTALAGKYVFGAADLNITLKLHRNGMYYLWMEGWAGVRTEETGAWELANREVVLHSTDGQIAALIQRLRPNSANNGQELEIIADGRNNGFLAGSSLRRENR
jgi:hypothetical protein